MIILKCKPGDTSAGTAALDFCPATARSVDPLAPVCSDTVYGFEDEGLMSIPVDKTHLLWRVQR